MGLKTDNFYVKKFDLTLPTAYAKLRTLVLNSNGTVSATFSIQQSRAHCEQYEPIEIVKVNTKAVWDRITPLEKFAYESAKNEKEVPDGMSSIFGWEDDFV